MFFLDKNAMCVLQCTETDISKRKNIQELYFSNDTIPKVNELRSSPTTKMVPHTPTQAGT